MDYEFKTLRNIGDDRLKDFSDDELKVVFRILEHNGVRRSELAAEFGHELSDSATQKAERMSIVRNTNYTYSVNPAFEDSVKSKISL